MFCGKQSTFEIFFHFALVFLSLVRYNKKGRKIRDVSSNASRDSEDLENARNGTLYHCKFFTKQKCEKMKIDDTPLFARDRRSIQHESTDWTF